MEWIGGHVQSGIEVARGVKLDWWTILSIVLGGLIAAGIAWWQQTASNRSLHRQLWYMAQLQVFLLRAIKAPEHIKRTERGPIG